MRDRQDRGRYTYFRISQIQLLPSLLQVKTQRQCNTTPPQKPPAAPLHLPPALTPYTSFSSPVSLLAPSPGGLRDIYTLSAAPRSYYHTPYTLLRLYTWRCFVFICVLMKYIRLWWMHGCFFNPRLFLWLSPFTISLPIMRVRGKNTLLSHH